MASVGLRGRARAERERNAAATTEELSAALAAHGITLPSMGPELFTYAGAYANPLVSLGNCDMDTARRLAAVLRGLGEGEDPVRRPPFRTRLLAVPHAAAELRRSVHRLAKLWGMPELAENAQVCVSELVTNVVQHVGEGAPVTLRLFMVEERLRIELTDPDPRALPVLLRATDDDEAGRGMALLDALTLRWGVEQHPDSKTTWCELDVSPVTDRA